MTRSEWSLIVVLRFGAVVLLLAALAVVMPASWMSAIHDQLGQGSLPELPIVGYLTRSLSLIYAYHGLLVFLLSFDVKRYGPVIRFLAWANIVFAAVMLAIDVAVGMPWYWSAMEPFGIAGFGVVVLLLQRKCPPLGQ